MHLGVLSWGLALHSMSQVITIFGFKDMGYFAIVASCQQQSDAFFFQIKLILILLFPFCWRKMAGDDPRIYLLTWQIRMDIYREGKKTV